MFCFGNSHSNWYDRKHYDQLYRVWRNMHHGGCRVPWLLYARSGDPKYLEYALNNTEFNLDIGICHYSTPEFESRRKFCNKIKGALTDYKGIVPYHSGGRLPDYNCMTDFMLYYYYLTGNPRGLEVAREWGEAVLTRARDARFSDRRGPATLNSLLNLYLATWDISYRELVEAHYRFIRALQNDEGVFTGHWPTYGPGMVNYWRTTGSEDAADFLVKWANSYLKYNLVTTSGIKNYPVGDSQLAYSYASGFAHYDILAAAYDITGDKKYLADGFGKMLKVAKAGFARNPRGQKSEVRGQKLLRRLYHSP